MKRLFCGIFTLILAAALLCGCESIVPDQTVICGDLTIVLPGYFLDLSDEEFARDFEMVYGLNDEAVCVIKEPAAELMTYFPNIDAEEYARLAVESYGLSSTVEIIGGIPSFTYSAEAEGMEFTYLVGVFQSETNFWMVQVYCNSADYEQKQSQMWEYIKTVQIDG